MRSLKLFLQCLIIFTVTLVLAEWLRTTKEDVAMNNIIERFKELSVTSCHLRCKSKKTCKYAGMKGDMMMGAIGECFLIKEGSINPIGETMQLNVMKTVPGDKGVDKTEPSPNTPPAETGGTGGDGGIGVTGVVSKRGIIGNCDMEKTNRVKLKTTRSLSGIYLSCGRGTNKVLSSFRMATMTGMRYYIYHCCSFSGSCLETQRETRLLGDGNGNVRNLAAHNVDCTSPGFISSFLLNSDGPNMNYIFSCCNPNINLSCYEEYTEWATDDGGDVSYLDRHSVTCTSSYALRSFKLQSNGGNIRYQFTCCKSAVI